MRGMEENPYKPPKPFEQVAAPATEPRRRFPLWIIVILVCWNGHAIFAALCVAYCQSLAAQNGTSWMDSFIMFLPLYAGLVATMVIGSPIVVWACRAMARWHKH